MSSIPERSNFISSIPNNKLEPVFIGRSDKVSSVDDIKDKKTGVYVPAFLKNKQDEVKSAFLEKEVTKKPAQKKPQLTKNDFPELSTSKAPSIVSNSDIKLAGRISFLDMLKKPKPEPISAEIVEKQVAQRGILVLGRGVKGQPNHSSSWADEDDTIDFSTPIQFQSEYLEEEEEYEDTEEFDE